jgi:hypothetical protein
MSVVDRIRIAGFVIALSASAAIADDGFTIGSRPVWLVTAGGTGGGSVAGTRGGFVGGELSLVRLIDNRMLGLYADAYYDFGIDGTYVTLGPELGLIRRSRAMPLAVGIDGGGVVRFADQRAFGATGRVFLALAGSLALFARYAYVDDTEDDHVIQLGVTLKFPLGPPFGAATRTR